MWKSLRNEGLKWAVWESKISYLFRSKFMSYRDGILATCVDLAIWERCGGRVKGMVWLDGSLY